MILFDGEPATPEPDGEFIAFLFRVYRGHKIIFHDAAPQKTGHHICGPDTEPGGRRGRGSGNPEVERRTGRAPEGGGGWDEEAGRLCLRAGEAPTAVGNTRHGVQVDLHWGMRLPSLNKAEHAP